MHHVSWLKETITIFQTLSDPGHFTKHDENGNSYRNVTAGTRFKTHCRKYIYGPNRLNPQGLNYGRFCDILYVIFKKKNEKIKLKLKKVAVTCLVFLQS